jgi:hypothetical protein
MPGGYIWSAAATALLLYIFMLVTNAQAAFTYSCSRFDILNLKKKECRLLIPCWELPCHLLAATLASQNAHVAVKAAVGSKPSVRWRH